MSGFPFHKAHHFNSFLYKQHSFISTTHSEAMDLNGDQPPFWSQPTTSVSMPPRRSSPPLLTLPLLIVILPIIGLVLLFFAIPPFLTITSQIFRPYGKVRKSWDSLTIVLVLFAILCGILARRNDEGSNPDDNANDVSSILDGVLKNSQLHQQGPKQWFGSDGYSNTKVYDRPITTSVTGTSRLRRSSSSYLDLRQESLRENDDDRFRFFDDLYAGPDNNDLHQLRRTRSDFEGYSDVKVIPVDTFVPRSPHESPPPPPKKSPTPPPPPPPPPPPAFHDRPRRTYQTVGRKDRNVDCDIDIEKVKSPPSTPPPPPPPRAPPPHPTVQMGHISEQKYVKIERRKSNATKMVFALFYNQSKRIKRKHRTKNVEEYGKPVHSPPEPTQSSTVPPSSPTPPPPPPPLPPHPSSVFHNLFKKSSKSKKVHSVPPPAPPPPPPPHSSKRSQAPPPPAPPTPPSSRRRNGATSGKPPLPKRANNSQEENQNSGNQSPLIPVPPPPPPFKMPESKFVVRRGFVRINSTRNSRCSSFDLEEADCDDSSTKESTTEKINMMASEDGVGSVFCPSPDVNIKADTFIAQLRDGWRLEKINSLREKQNWARP